MRLLRPKRNRIAQDASGLVNSTPDTCPPGAFLRASLNSRLRFAAPLGKLPSMEIDRKWWIVLASVLAVALAIGISVGLVLLASRRDDEREK